MKINAILLMAGMSSRFNDSTNKVIYEINEKPLFIYSLDVLYNHKNIEHIYITVNKNNKDEITNIIENNYNMSKITIIEGGATRSHSVRNAIACIDADYVLIHDSARPLIQHIDIDNLISQMPNYKCGTLAHKVYDTIKEVDSGVKTVDRNKLYAVSTPQFFHKSLYQQILNPELDEALITDEISLFEKKEPVAFVLESRNNLKVTTVDDLDYVRYILEGKKEYKVGHSFDLHTLEEGRKLILGGVTFDTSYGLKGHSDADVVYHVVAESLMGALGIGDLGTLFPDTDPKFKGQDSKYFVEEVMKRLVEQQYLVENIDVIIYLEKPNLKNYKKQMAQNIKALTACSYVNVKATTLEKQGIIGKGYGIASEAVCLIRKK